MNYFEECWKEFTESIDGKTPPIEYRNMKLAFKHAWDCSYNLGQEDKSHKELMDKLDKLDKKWSK